MRIGLLLALFVGAIPCVAESMVPAMSIPRMGAGAPGGWRVRMEQADWAASTDAGPFGAGAARIALQADGRVELASPAQTLHFAQPYTALVWARAEREGATLRLELNDNRGDKTLAKADLALQAAWQPLVVHLDRLPEKASGECYLACTLRGGAGAVHLDGLWLGEGTPESLPDLKPALPSHAVTLTPVGPWGVTAGAAPLRVRARVAGAPSTDLHVRLHIEGSNGAAADLPLYPFADGEMVIDDPALLRYGMYRASATVVGADGKASSAVAETLLARVPEPLAGPMPNSFFGAHVKLQEPDLSAVAALGYKWCRIHDASGITKWGIAEPEPGQWKWFDDEVALVRGHGMSILGMLDGSPPWESGIKDSGYFSIFGAPRNVDHWRNYVRTVVGHYKDAIGAWEVWNEPWDLARFFQNGTPLYYAELLQAAYAEAKATDPACTVVGVDTYPPIWEKMVLSSGAYPNYDVLSWHRYDPNLHAFPGDSLSRVAARINAEQAKYGAPKPLMCSEAGPDVARFHGSFFSFADPAIVGDWSRGADQYARLYLGAIAAGNQRLFAYTLHIDPRHGQRVQALTEPGILLKPMHLELAALAHFVDGARYVERLRPTPDISAHLFEQTEARDYAAGGALVVALHADGEAEETLPRALPTTVKAFDRWGNPAALPATATRGLCFLVAEGDARTALRAALDGGTAPRTVEAAERPAAIRTLLAEFVQACGTEAPLWPFFSTQGSSIVLSNGEALLRTTREDLRAGGEAAARFLGAARLGLGDVTNLAAGPFHVGTAMLSRAEGAPVPLSYSVAFDGPGAAPRFLSLTLQLGKEDPTSQAAIDGMLRRWEAVFKDASTESLRDVFSPGKVLLAVSTANGEYFVFNTPDYLRTMLDTAVMWGKAMRSAMNIEQIHADATSATVRGTWDLASMSLGAGRNPFTATLAREGEAWRFASLSFGAPE